MKIVSIKKSITINASPKNVWEVLFDNQVNKQWLGFFLEGCYAETDWQAGSKVLFCDKDGNGLVGTIETSNYPHQLVISYNGFLTGNKEDVDSEMAKLYNGYKESYYLTESEGATVLDVSSDMGEDYYDAMSGAWNKALNEIRTLAEAK